MRFERLPRVFYQRGPVAVARALLGQRLVHVVGGERHAGRIVEVEAYLGRRDRAAHSFGGRRTARNAAMYARGGTAYVFQTYGVHFLFNVVVGRAEDPVAVLVRALEPTEGLDAMRRRRPRARRDTDLCSGPGKLGAALAIDRSHDGVDLVSSPSLFIERARRRAYPASRIVAGPRVGVGYAGAWAGAPLRFYVRGDPHVSPA